MYHYHDGDDFDAHRPHYRPAHEAHLLSPRWQRRALGVALLGLLVLMHSCG